MAAVVQLQRLECLRPFTLRACSVSPPTPASQPFILLQPQLSASHCSLVPALALILSSCSLSCSCPSAGSVVSFFFENYVIFNHVYLCVCLCTINTGACGGWRHQIPPELELQEVESCPVWVLGIQTRSCAETVPPLVPEPSL